jgi:uncharacterized protein (TIGR02246 family)
VSVSNSVLAEDEAAVLNAMEALNDAWNNNDANAFADLYTEDATIVTVEGLYCKGREPIRGLMTMLYGGPFKGSKLFNKSEDVKFITPDVAVAISWNAILFGGLTELPPEENRRATWTLAKKDGQWLVSAFQNVFITEPKIEVS